MLPTKKSEETRVTRAPEAHVQGYALTWFIRWT